MNGKIIAAKSHQPCFPRFIWRLPQCCCQFSATKFPVPEASLENSKNVSEGDLCDEAFRVLAKDQLALT
jgi:hypothetical protein